jgi:hypothetical protein
MPPRAHGHVCPAPPVPQSLPGGPERQMVAGVRGADDGCCRGRGLLDEGPLRHVAPHLLACLDGYR